MKIAVLTDSGSGLTKQQANDLGIHFLPLQILQGDQQYLDGIDIDIKEVYQYLKEGKNLTTSMPPMGKIEEMFETLKQEGYEEVICVPITSGLSSTASVIAASAQDIDLNVHIIDCYSTCHLQQYIAKSAKKLVDQELSVEEIVKRLESAIALSNTLIIPDDLQHLKRGGRLTPVAATLGSLLKIKPILQLNASCNGKIDVFDKVRTMSKAQQKAIDTFLKEGVKEGYVLICLHAGVEEEGKQFAKRLKDSIANVEVEFGYIGAVISVHTGIGCMGIQYIKQVEGL